MAPKRATRSTRATTTTPAPTATTTTTVTNAQLQAMIDQGVSAALAARDATRNGTDSHSSGTGVRGSERVARECTYQDFMKCKPLYFKGTEGVVELTQWFERMETVFRISNCSVENQNRLTMESVHGKKDKLKTKEVSKTLPEAIKSTTTSKKEAENRARPTLQAIGQRNHTPGLNLCVPSVITIMKVRVLQSAINATRTLQKGLSKNEDNKGNACNQAGNNRAFTAKVDVVWKCGANPTTVVSGFGASGNAETAFIRELHFVEEPVEIVGREVKRLKRSRIPLVKVRWNSKRGPEFTWEREDQFKKKYPHLFTKTTPSSSAAS
ncbi:hypothetical protein Tco_0583349 [Tanacetum coccineum]